MVAKLHKRQGLKYILAIFLFIFSIISVNAITETNYLDVVKGYTYYFENFEFPTRYADTGYYQAVTSCGGIISHAETPYNFSIYDKLSNSTYTTRAWGWNSSRESLNISCGTNTALSSIHRPMMDIRNDGILNNDGDYLSSGKYLLKANIYYNYTSYLGTGINSTAFDLRLQKGNAEYYWHIYIGHNGSISFKAESSIAPFVPSCNAPQNTLPKEQLNEVDLILDIDNHIYSIFVNGNSIVQCANKSYPYTANLNLTTPYIFFTTQNAWQDGTFFIDNIEFSYLLAYSGQPIENTTVVIPGQPSDIVGQIAPAFEDLGFISQSSKIFLGLVVIIALNICLLFMFMKTKTPIGVGHYGILLIVTLLATITLTILHFFPYWILFVIIFMMAGIGALIIRNQAFGG